MKTMFINDSIDHINKEAIDNSSAKLIPNNSLLMVIRSGILKKQLPLAINNTIVTINQDMKAFIFNDKKVSTEFMYYFFTNYQRVLLSKVRAVTADNIDFNQIKNTLVPVPPIEEQDKFKEIVYYYLKQSEKLKIQLEELETNFQALLQKAFKGELVIKDKLNV